MEERARSWHVARTPARTSAGRGAQRSMAGTRTTPQTALLNQKSRDIAHGRGLGTYSTSRLRNRTGCPHLRTPMVKLTRTEFVKCQRRSMHATRIRTAR
eukprot:1911234-Pleurochrysis_carterae.AAC.1